MTDLTQQVSYRSLVKFLKGFLGEIHFPSLMTVKKVNPEFRRNSGF